MRPHARGVGSVPARLVGLWGGRAVVAVVLSLLATLVGSALAAGSASNTVSVSSARYGRSIPSGFLGLAFEFRTVPTYIGRDTDNPNNVLVQLIRNLDPRQRPNLRIGGESTDRTWWPVPHMHRPWGITNELGPGWIKSARLLADATGGRLTLGVNLEANRLKITETEAWAFYLGIGRKRIQALELGNEPELYTVVPWYELDNGQVVPWYQKRHGTPVLARRPGYSFDTFSHEFSRFRKVLPHGVPLGAPSTGNPYWLADMPRFLSTQRPLSLVTFHRYGLNGCVISPSNRTYPSIPNLLTLYASRGIMDGVPHAIALAHKRGVKFRIDEMNSVTCGGRDGVSNTFASALWVLDALFNMAADGVDGINIHTFPGSLNGLFDFGQLGSRWVGTVNPEYYGLLMFAQAAPRGARLLRLSSPGGPDIRAWATRERGGTVHVVLINDSLTRAHSLQITAPARGTAQLERLLAPSAAATSGETLGGQSFGAGTTTGLLSGPPQTTGVDAAGGSYKVTLPAASAAMLTWKR